MKSTRACRGKCLDPLKARCSTRWASPRVLVLEHRPSVDDQPEISPVTSAHGFPQNPVAEPVLVFRRHDAGVDGSFTAKRKLVRPRCACSLAVASRRGPQGAMQGQRILQPLRSWLADIFKSLPARDSTMRPVWCSVFLFFTRHFSPGFAARRRRRAWIQKTGDAPRFCRRVSGNAPSTRRKTMQRPRFLEQSIVT